MGKWNRWGRTLAAVVLAAAVVCGCGVKETLLSGRKSEREYGKAETMVIVTTERLRYEELYTDKLPLFSRECDVLLVGHAAHGL